LPQCPITGIGGVPNHVIEKDFVMEGDGLYRSAKALLNVVIHSVYTKRSTEKPTK
jgi:hypothetical protein